MRAARTENSIRCGIAAIAIAAAWPLIDAAGAQAPQQTPAPVATPVPVPRHTHAWSRAISAPGVAAVAVSAHYIAVAGPEAGLAMYKTSDGTPVWSSDRRTALPPVFAGEFVVVVGSDRVSAVRAATGDLAWDRPEDAAGAATALLATVDAVVLVGPQQIRAWGHDGTPKWTRTITAGNAPRATASSDRLYVSMQGPTIASLDPATGEVVASAAAASEPLHLSVQAGRLLSGGSDGQVAAYKLDPLSRDWSYQKVDATGPLAADARLAYAALIDNTLYAFGLGNGHQRWSRQLPTRPRGSPVLVDGRVIVVLADGRLAQYAANDKGTALPEEPSPDASIRILGMAAAPDGQLIAAIGAPADNSRQLMAWRGAPPPR